MHANLRQSAAWLHTWTGLTVGWVLFFVFVTGTAGYFQLEITRWMQPERAVPQAQRHDLPALARMADLGLQRLQQVAPVAANWRISLPHQATGDRGWQEFAIRWEQMPESGHEYGASSTEKLDPGTGAVLPAEAEPRATSGGFGLYRMHYELRYMPYAWAIRIVGVCTMLMLLAIVSGVITHRKIFADFFLFRPGKGQRSWLDAHNAISVMALPFFLMITYSGLVFFMFAYMPAGKSIVYGTDPAAQSRYYEELFEDEHHHAPAVAPAVPLAALIAQAYDAWGPGQLAAIVLERHEGGPPEVVLQQVRGRLLHGAATPQLRFHAETGAALPDKAPPGGSAARTQNVLLALHEGLFATPWGRWLYFIAGLLGCAMIATGLVLWTVKRRRHHLGSGREGLEDFGLRLVEHLNVATIAGLPLAVAMYFWANRLLPVDMADRAAWEFHSLFAAWLATWFYALARPLARAWIELLWGCCLAYALVPVVNALTTDRHLGQSLPAGDWVFAGFDLTMLALAALFAAMAVKVRRRLAPRAAALPAGLVPAKGMA